MSLSTWFHLLNLMHIMAFLLQYLDVAECYVATECVLYFRYYRYYYLTNLCLLYCWRLLLLLLLPPMFEFALFVEHNKSSLVPSKDTQLLFELKIEDIYIYNLYTYYVILIFVIIFAVICLVDEWPSVIFTVVRIGVTNWIVYILWNLAI